MIRYAVVPEPKLSAGLLTQLTPRSERRVGDHVILFFQLTHAGPAFVAAEDVVVAALTAIVNDKVFIGFYSCGDSVVIKDRMDAQTGIILLQIDACFVCEIYIQTGESLGGLQHYAVFVRYTLCKA